MSTEQQTETQKNTYERLKSDSTYLMECCAMTAIEKAYQFGKAKIVLTFALEPMGAEMSIKRRWKVAATESDGEELEEITVSNQPELLLQ